MNAELFVKLIDTVIWPLIMLWISYLFKSEIKQVFTRIESVKYKEIEARFKDILVVAENALENNPNFELLNDKDLEKYYKITRMVEYSPRVAVIESWLELEQYILKIQSNSPENNEYLSATDVINDLISKKIIRAGYRVVIKELKSLRNEAIHRPEFAIGQEEALDYVKLCAVCEKKIREECANMA